jgi:preprotein translocase subunit SecD
MKALAPTLLSATLLFALPALSSAQERSFGIVRINPGPGVKTRTIPVEADGRRGRIVVEAEPRITRADVRDVTASSQRVPVTTGSRPETREVPTLLITFTEAGRQKFSELTRTWQGRQLGVLINQKVVATPQVRDEIAGGELAITGNFDANESRLLAASLNGRGPEAIAEPPQQKKGGLRSLFSRGARR